MKSAGKNIWEYLPSVDSRRMYDKLSDGEKGDAVDPEEGDRRSKEGVEGYPEYSKNGTPNPMTNPRSFDGLLADEDGGVELSDLTTKDFERIHKLASSCSEQLMNMSKDLASVLEDDCDGDMGSRIPWLSFVSHPVALTLLLAAIVYVG